MDEEDWAIYCAVRDEIHKTLGHDVKISVIMPPGHRRRKRRGSKKNADRMIAPDLFGGTDNDKKDDI